MEMAIGDMWPRVAPKSEQDGTRLSAYLRHTVAYRKPTPLFSVLLLIHSTLVCTGHFRTLHQLHFHFSSFLIN